MNNTPNQATPEKAAINPFSGENSELVRNPFSLFAQMRSIGAVIPIPFPMPGIDGRAWAITRMEEAVQVLKDHAHFTVDPSFLGSKGIFGGGNADTSDTPTFFTAKSMLRVDEPDHRRLRLLVSKAFTPRYIAGLRPRVQEIADELLDGVQDQGQMELVGDYAFRLPINVISEMLGVPHADRDQIRVWSEAMAKQGMGMRDEKVYAAMRAFGAYTVQLVADKRQHPAEDLISQMIKIEEGGDRLSETELLSTITLLIFAGHETTSNLIANGTLMLFDYPDQLEKLKADLSLVPSAVEELLRFHGPALSRDRALPPKILSSPASRSSEGMWLYPSSTRRITMRPSSPSQTSWILCARSAAISPLGRAFISAWEHRWPAWKQTLPLPPC